MSAERPPSPIPGSSSTGPARLLMVQGVSSNAGKSIVSGALCRYLRDTGRRVAPFKPLLVLEDEIESDGRTTDSRFLFCTRAAGVPLREECNPIQIIPTHRDRFGRILSPATMRLPGGETFEVPLLAADTPAYPEFEAGLREKVWATVERSLLQLRQEYDVVVVEGAGSPSDLGTEDIGNYFVPHHHEVATLLVGKISAGGAGASLVGTMEMLPADVRRTVRGFVLNNLIGAEATAMAMASRLEDRLGLPCIGVMPNLWTLSPWGSPEEELDSLAGIVRERLRTDLLFGDEPDRALTSSTPHDVRQ